jgi:hypothetical protein
LAFNPNRIDRSKLAASELFKPGAAGKVEHQGKQFTFPDKESKAEADEDMDPMPAELRQQLAKPLLKKATGDEAVHRATWMTNQSFIDKMSERKERAGKKKAGGKKKAAGKGRTPRANPRKRKRSERKKQVSESEEEEEEEEDSESSDEEEKGEPAAEQKGSVSESLSLDANPSRRRARSRNDSDSDSDADAESKAEAAPASERKDAEIVGSCLVCEGHVKADQRQLLCGGCAEPAHEKCVSSRARKKRDGWYCRECSKICVPA